MKIILKIKTNPISVNSAYYSRNKQYNEKTRIWRANFLIQLQNSYNQHQISLLKKSFDPSKHCLRVCFIWYQPKDIIFNKAGQISLRGQDVDNLLKIPTDLLFDKKYCTEWLSILKGKEAKLYSITSLKNIDLNDKFIIDTRSIKLPSSDDFHCTVEVEIVDLPTPL